MGFASLQAARMGFSFCKVNHPDLQVEEARSGFGVREVHGLIADHNRSGSANALRPRARGGGCAPGAGKPSGAGSGQSEIGCV
jgi:hypothetical protein